jgi:glycosyltransferase involved in cell wall biosynthesis
MRLSAIVCTRNRSRAIIQSLASIAASLEAAAPVEAEIVVIDNGSTDDTSAIVSEWAKSCAVPVRLAVEPRTGLSAARNCGLKMAKGDLLVFTDDDCRLDPAYMRLAIRHDDADTGPVLRGGRVELGDPADLPLTIKTDPHPADFAHPLHPAGFLLGANMILSRKVIDRIGFFDERFGAGTRFPGEDCDYIIRAHAAGIPVRYAPDLIVSHFHGRRDPAVAKALFAGYMRANGALYIKHFFSSPLLIRHFWWDLRFWLKERRGHPSDLHLAGIGHRQVVFHCLIGMAQFTWLRVKMLFAGGFRPGLSGTVR